MPSSKRTSCNNLNNQRLPSPGSDSVQNPHIKEIPHYFLLSISAALIFWITESTIHFLKYDKSSFELIPSSSNDLWIRLSVCILLLVFGVFVEYKSRIIINSYQLHNQAVNIALAKRQWELVVDSLPQLVIAMDQNANITRVNRTVELWSKKHVNNLAGVKVSELLTHFEADAGENKFAQHWSNLWKDVSRCNSIKVKTEHTAHNKTYLLNLRKISDYDTDYGQCYAVLIIHDITAQERYNKDLKQRNVMLEDMVNDRTQELQSVNNKLHLELLEKQSAYSQLKLTCAKLNESQKSQQALLKELFTAQENERKRIAYELHDSIGQSLGAAKFKIEEILLSTNNIADTRKQDHLTILRDIIKHTISETRHIALDLRPAMIDELGILPTINWFCREFNNTYSHLDVKLIIHIDESAIPDKIKIVIFRIIQESFNNTVKHANASKATLRLQLVDHEINLTISDDGDGISSASKQFIAGNPGTGGFGLNSMRERAESTDGKFKIASSPGSGTTISVVWKNTSAAHQDERLLTDFSKTANS